MTYSEQEIKTNDKLMHIVETITIGEDPNPWDRSDYLQFYRDSAFRVAGVVAALCLIILPMRIQTENSQLLQGSGLSLLPMCIFGNSAATGGNKSNKKKAAK